MSYLIRRSVVPGFVHTMGLARAEDGTVIGWRQRKDAERAITEMESAGWDVSAMEVVEVDVPDDPQPPQDDAQRA